MNLALDYTGANLVFVVGCPRSGTTWIQRLLATHPMLRTGQESDVFDLYIGPQLRAWERELDPASSGRGGVGLACYFQDAEFRRVLKQGGRAVIHHSGAYDRVSFRAAMSREWFAALPTGPRLIRLTGFPALGTSWEYLK